MKILVLTSRFPFPLEKGDKLRIYNQMQALSRTGHEIVLIALTEELINDNYLKELKPFCTNVYALRLTKLAIFNNILQNILRGIKLPFQVAYFFNSQIKKQINDIIIDTQPDHIYCHLVRMSEYVKGVTNVPKTLDFMDAFGAGTKRRAAISTIFTRFLWHFEAKLMLNYEKQIAPYFNSLTIISEQDRERLPISQSLITIVGNGVDIDYFSLINYEKKNLEQLKYSLDVLKEELVLNKNNSKLNKNELINQQLALNDTELINDELNRINNELEAIKNNSALNKSELALIDLELNKNNSKLNKNDFELNKSELDLIKNDLELSKTQLTLIKNHVNAVKRYDVCFVGNLGYYSNVEAVRFLVKKIVPLLKKAKPDIKILIAGARPTTEIQYLGNENITVLGWLDDIREAYVNSRILVAPLMHGIGQQNKILEAMAMHVPVVSTSRVNNAIGATPETEILVADTEGVFAEQILRLLQDIDLQNLMSDNGRAFVEKRYSWAGATAALERLISGRRSENF